MARRRRVIICVAGMPGSGKGVFKRAAESLGIPRISMGDIVRSETARRGLTPNYRNTASIMLEMRREAGPDVFAKLTWKAIRDVSDDVVLIDGVRSLEEVNYFKQFGDVVVVAVHSSPSTRFERLRRRGRPDDVKTYEEFEERDARELGVGLGSVVALADYMLINDRITKGEAVERARQILENVVKVCNE